MYLSLGVAQVGHLPVPVTLADQVFDHLPILGQTLAVDERRQPPDQSSQYRRWQLEPLESGPGVSGQEQDEAVHG